MSYASLAPYGWNDRWVALFASADPPPGAVPGRVVRHDSSALLVAQPTTTCQVGLASTLPDVTVGDWVVVGADTAVGLLARLSLLRRLDPLGGREQLLAANVDVVVIVAGLDRPVKDGRLQRFATLAWDAGAVPVVVLSKADLVDDAAVSGHRVAAANPGVEVVVTSARLDEGLDAVRAIVQERTVVVLGESGAGKSTLINALAGESVTGTGRVRTGDAKGRHTTTFRQLHLLAGGGCVIDTPGLRAVGLTGAPDAVRRTFADVEQLAPECRFRDCAHDGEPGCAVRASVDEGGLAPERLEAWRAMLREARAADLRADERARRQADRRFGRMAREAQRHKPRPSSNR